MAQRVADVMHDSLAAGVRERVFPGGIAALMRTEGPVVVAAAGCLGDEPDDPVPRPDTLYDLASLTKVVATLPAVLLSVQAGRLSLTDPVSRWLPEFVQGTDESGKREITVVHLLAHTSGLPAWRPFYLGTHGRDGYLAAIAAEPLLAPPGSQVVYSDLGFILLGFLLERVWDQPLDELVHDRVFTPLGMIETRFRPQSRLAEADQAIAPTELGHLYERQSAFTYARERRQGQHPPEAFPLTEEQVESFAWRRERIRGEVHDGNAHYGLDGVSGHAGLFSTVTDLVRYMRVWLEGTPESAEWLDPVLRRWAVRSLTGDLVPRRAAGWEASATGGTLAHLVRGCTGGDLLSPDAFGHTGFTGTSIWCDPERETVLITLTNRVYRAVDEQMVLWRRRHHNIVFAAVSRVWE